MACGGAAGAGLNRRGPRAVRRVRAVSADHLFSDIDELGTRDGSNLTVDGYEFAPSFSIWTTIEECLNPPVIWEADRGWFTTEPFSEPEVFDFPGSIGPVECVNVEHEEVLLMPRWVKCRRATFKYGLGTEFIDVLKTLHKLGLDRTEKVAVGGVQVSPRDVVAACLPNPATLGPKMHGKTCAGLWVTGTGQDGNPRSTYLYHVSTTSGRCRSTATSVWSGRPRSIPLWRWNFWPTEPGPVPGCSAPRHSTGYRSWSCSPRMDPHGGSKNSLPRACLRAPDW